jgi:hypothetical protein
MARLNPRPCHSAPERLLGSVLERYGEFCFAGFGGVVEGGAFACALRGAEEKSLFGAVGKSGEAGVAASIGSDLKIQFMKVHESVGDVDLDVGGVDWRASGIGDGEVGRARADGAIDDGDGSWIHGLGVWGWQGG